MKKKNYKYLIFDADHTLLDYTADEYAAFTALFTEWGAEFNKDQLDTCHFLSEKAWADAGLLEVDKAEIQSAYHFLYRNHLTLLFVRIFHLIPSLLPCAEKFYKTERVKREEEEGDIIAEDFIIKDTEDVIIKEMRLVRTADEAGKSFLTLLEEEANFMPGAPEVLRALSKKGNGSYKICVATNGLHAIQTGRLRGVTEYLYKMYISEDIGIIKPSQSFFHYILADLHAEKEECLMIGDSLISDIAGAKGAGIDSCWLNAEGKTAPPDLLPTYEVDNLSALIALLKE